MWCGSWHWGMTELHEATPTINTATAIAITNSMLQACWMPAGCLLDACWMPAGMPAGWNMQPSIADISSMHYSTKG